MGSFFETGGYANDSADGTAIILVKGRCLARFRRARLSEVRTIRFPFQMRICSDVSRCMVRPSFRSKG